VVHFKVCGITCIEDAEASVSVGANAIGINLIPVSPRAVDADLARTIARQVGDRSNVILVVANLGTVEALQLLEYTGAGCLQLHGDESAATVRQMLPRAYKAVRIATAEDVERAVGFPGDDLLVDAKVSGKLGGTGKTVDWAIVAPIARARRLTLAGGLTPENVGRAIEVVGPYRVDVASGVESPDNPRRKDPDRLLAFSRVVKTSASW
jgi:phosphoribosylanthranilate isomerase